VIRTIWLAIHLILATLVLASYVIVTGWLRVPASHVRNIATTWSRWVLWATGVTVTAEGTEHLVPGRAQIVAANHSSWFDVAALCVVIPKGYRFIAKQELARVPMWGRAWLRAGHIAIDRENTQRAVETLDEAARIARSDGSAIVIFPEGTRSATGELQTFKKGAFMLALHAGIEIVPAGIRGSREILPKNSWRVRSGRIIVRFGPPVPVTEYSAKSRDQLVARVRNDIAGLMTGPEPQG
jgi:1-acyl-sn-glycerol-3-phosphate acyltransferase